MIHRFRLSANPGNEELRAQQLNKLLIPILPTKLVREAIENRGQVYVEKEPAVSRASERGLPRKPAYSDEQGDLSTEQLITDPLHSFVVKLL